MTNKIVTSENTKLIAEWISDKYWLQPTIETKIPNNWICLNAGKKCEPFVLVNQSEYNPITNAKQSRELEKKLLYKCGWIIEVFGGVMHISYQPTGFKVVIKESNFELAIYKAALHEANKNEQ